MASHYKGPQIMLFFREILLTKKDLSYQKLAFWTWEFYRTISARTKFLFQFGITFYKTAWISWWLLCFQTFGAKISDIASLCKPHLFLPLAVDLRSLTLLMLCTKLNTHNHTPVKNSYLLYQTTELPVTFKQTAKRLL